MCEHILLAHYRIRCSYFSLENKNKQTKKVHHTSDALLTFWRQIKNIPQNKTKNLWPAKRCLMLTGAGLSPMVRNSNTTSIPPHPPTPKNPALFLFHRFFADRKITQVALIGAHGTKYTAMFHTLIFFLITPEDKVTLQTQMTLKLNVTLDVLYNNNAPCPDYTCVALSLSFLDSLWCSLWSLSFFFFKKPKTPWPFFFSCLSSRLPSNTGRPPNANAPVVDLCTAWKTQDSCFSKSNLG